METTFQTLGTNTYLNMKLDPEDTIDSMSLGMLTNNKIPGLAETTFTQMDDTRYIRYNVSSKVSAAQIFTGTVNKKRLIGVLSGIADAMMSAEEYMLDPKSFMLNLDYIFVDVSTCETVMVCVPILDLDQKNPDLSTFFKDIMFHSQFDQTENCNHVAQIINYLNSNPTFCLKDFKEVLDSTAEEPSACAPAPKAQPAAQAPKVQPSVPTQPRPATAQPVVNSAASQPVQRPQQPVVPSQAPAQPADQAPAAENDKKMSVFYLLQHYNKENVEKYKNQKNNKTAASKEAKPAKASKKSKSSKSDKTSKAAAGFKVPGAPKTAPGGFAVPGQPTPAPGAKAGGFAVPGQPTPAPGAKPAANAYTVPGAPVQNAQSAAPVMPQTPAAPASPISFGETTVLGGEIGETTVLGATNLEVKQDPHLIRVKNNEKIPLDKPVFRIGKERSYVDYFVSDNTAISRSHANIVNRDGTYYIVDTNSTNHTYVDGRMISPNEEVKLSDGAKIRLANEEFDFKMN